MGEPISFIEYNELVSTRGQVDLLLRKHLDAPTHNVDAPGCTTYIPAPGVKYERIQMIITTQMI